MTISDLLQNGVRERAFPGATWAVGNSTHAVTGAVGRLTYDHQSRATTSSTIYDLASLTKVVSTTSLAMMLWQDGLLDLEAPACHYWPEFGENGKESVTIRNLLCHNSGLIAFRKYHEMDIDGDGLLARIAAENLIYPTGQQMVYSDLGFITLGHIIERITEQTLRSLFHNKIAQPLGMKTAKYGPIGSIDTVAPTERVTEWRNNLRKSKGMPTGALSAKVATGEALICGEVHDETCLLLGGATGHAGLFASLEDLVKFCQFLLGGPADGDRYLPSLGTIHAFVRRQSMASSRALGWDTRSLAGYSSAGKLFGRHAYGHTGFTGTSIWIDPEAERFAVLLTNRVCPTRDNEGLGDIRPLFADLAYPLKLA